MTRHSTTRAALAALLLTGAACEEPSVADLTLTVREAPYPRARCGKGTAREGPLFPQGSPVAGAQVVLKPGGLRGQTDRSGRVTLRRVPQREYSLYVVASGYRTDPARAVRVPSAAALEVRLTPCVSAGSPRLRVGFDSPVRLRARNLCGAEWERPRYRWSQLEGPAVHESVRAWREQSLSFKTASLLAARGTLPDEPQVLSFSHDQAGEYVFELEATNPGGERSVSRVLVTSTNVASGMTSVPSHQRYYFVGPKAGPWKWQLVQSPPGWRVELEGLDTRTPSVLAVPPGLIEQQQNVTLREQHSQLTFSLALGAWNVVRRDCGRADCHASMENHWKATKHASSWQRLLDGKLPIQRGAGEMCADCHSMGYDPSADDGGYDDLARRHEVQFPAQLADGNFARLPPEVKDVSNVYCLACHGPARVDPPVAEQPGLFQVGVCARCHDRVPEQSIVAQWRLSKHARTITNDINGPDRRRECARCHSAQGFYYHFAALSRPPSTRTAVLTCCENAAPVTCQACHNAMLAHQRAGLHRHGTVTTGSGVVLENVDSGAQCIVCHSASVDPDHAQTLARRQGPHAPQADLTYGRGGYALPVPASYPKLEGIACGRQTKRSCVTCHMHPGPAPGQPGHLALGGHTFRMFVADEARPDQPPLQNVAACQPCHPGTASFEAFARADFDGDGAVEGARSEVDGLLALLKARIEAALRARAHRGCSGATGWSFASGFRQRIVVVDAQGRDLGDCDRNGVIEREEQPFTFPDADLLLHKAAFNWLLVKLDRSRGLHNLPYVVKLLQRTIHAVSAGADLPPWTLRK